MEKLKCVRGAKPSMTEKYINEGSTVIYIAVEKVLTGYIVLSDTIRKESKAMIKELKKIGVQTVLLTGDNSSTGCAIASQLGVSEVHASCLPEDKLNYISDCQTNDIAVDAADIVLVDDEIKELPHLISLSKKMITSIKINLTFSMMLNFIAITFAITGLLGPVIGALVHNAGSVLVITNSAMLLKWKDNKAY